jgi:hypothetical protein
MLLPPLSTTTDNVALATSARFEIVHSPQDISPQVAKTWSVCPLAPARHAETNSRDISLSLVTDPAVWKLAWSKGADVIAFLRSFQAMRAGFASGAFQYHVMAFQKPA